MSFLTTEDRQIRAQLLSYETEAELAAAEVAGAVFHADNVDNRAVAATLPTIAGLHNMTVVELVSNRINTALSGSVAEEVSPYGNRPTVY